MLSSVAEKCYCKLAYKKVLDTVVIKSVHTPVKMPAFHDVKNETFPTFNVTCNLYN